MLRPVKLGIKTAHDYHAEELANASNAYYSQNGKIAGVWQGQLAAEMGLAGAVTEEAYHRIVDGQHPFTGEQLIAHRDTWKTREGLEASHIPCFDFCFSLPKSWSLVACVGEDKRIFLVAEECNRKALEVMESYAQARGGGDKPSITTGKLAIATFQHDTSRPENGYPAPLVHFHNLLMNMQRTADGKWRSLNERELFRIQKLGLAVFRAELEKHARALGYITRIDAETGAPEIKGISREYIEHESPRHEKIHARAKELGYEDSKAAQAIIAKSEREDKLDIDPSTMRTMHREHGMQYREELEITVSGAIERGPTIAKHPKTPEKAVTFAMRRESERKAIFEHYELLWRAVKYGRGTVSVEDIEAEVKRRVEEKKLVEATHYRPHAPAARYSTPEMIALEKDTIARVIISQNTVEPILENADLGHYLELADNKPRQEVLRGILATRDQVVAIQGTAGSAKSTSAAILRDFAEAQGFTVKGLAPTGSARDSLQEKGITSDTLAMHIVKARSADHASHRKTFYILDEASLSSTKALNEFLRTLHTTDHVVLIGDDPASGNKVGQHTSVEAGRVFQQLQEAGMKTAQLNKIYRQKTEELKQVVLGFRHGMTAEAIQLLDSQGRVHEWGNKNQRYREIARTYCEQPKGTLVISPDNKSRQELNQVIRTIRDEMQKQGYIVGQNHEMMLLTTRDVNGVDCTQADSYRFGDVVKYRGGNKALGIEKCQMATVLESDHHTNLVTVQMDNGRTLTYDPSICSGVSVYEKAIRDLSVGDRVQFTERFKSRGISTRDMGTVKAIDADGNIEVTLDRKNRNVKWNLSQHRHLDYAYTMTSHSAQSKTVNRVLIHVDTSDSRLRALINKVMAYVGASRAEYDIQVFTDEAANLHKVMGRPNEATKALSYEQTVEYAELAKQIRNEKVHEYALTV